MQSRFAHWLAHLTFLAVAGLTAPPLLAQAAPKPRPQTVKPAARAVEPATSKGWRIAARPSWVVESGVAGAEPPTVTPGGARRHALLDIQVNHALPRMQYYLRARTVASDAQALGEVSQPRITFNPAFQSIMVHAATVTREGRTVDRLKDARLELMRRETQLERQVIDGTETLLVVLSDVRVGDVVDLAYTVEGENPIFEGRIGGVLEVATNAVVDRLHQRVVAPIERTLQLRSIGSDLLPERSVEGKLQVLRLQRDNIAAVVEELGTPPWFKVYPAWQYTEYASWSEVDAWAGRLFTPAQQAGPLVRERVEGWRASGLQGEALVADVLRFVQDEVRYFSVSLGESSHRPKPAERTLTERLGDCKDKVVLLNTLLTELGFQPRPALVSMHRNRGLASYLPTHHQFDHVVTQLVLNGRTWTLDATVGGQGTTLAERGHFPYGRALVVGAGGDLSLIADAPSDLNHVEFVQRWDLSKPGHPIQLNTTLKARGLAAERWRAWLAMAGEQRMAETLAGAHARATPGLKANGAPRVSDDRTSNTWEMTLAFEHPNFGTYASGALEIDLGAIELVDILAGPPEARRRTPFLFDQPKTATSRIELLASRPFTSPAPPPAEVADRHFLFTSRVEPSGLTVAFVRRFERRADEVQATDLPSFRESLNKARAMSGNRMRVGYLDAKELTPEFERIDRKVRAARDFRNDTLARLQVRNEITRAIDLKMLAVAKPQSLLAAQVLASSAQAANLLGDFAAGLQDADSALAIEATQEAAIEARAVALVGLNRLDEATAAFDRLMPTPRRTTAMKWLASIDVFRGRHAQAEQVLRDVVAQGGGADRDFALLWLYLAAEHQGRRGKAAIAPFVEAVDAKLWTGALLHFLDGRLDRDGLLKRARESTDMERLNLAEAYFFIGQQLSARGQREDAMSWFARSVDTKASPYREVTFAQLEIKRGR
jgi:lipoprotein NlpI